MSEQLKEVVPMYGDVPFTLEFDFPDEYKEKALIELGESPENVAQSLEEFRELVRGEPELQLPLDQEICRIFLRRCKWHPENAFSLAKRLYRFKLKHPEIYTGYQIDPYCTSFMSGTIRLLPLRDRNGCRIILVTLHKDVWDPRKIPTNDMFKHLQMAVNAFISEERTQVAGIHTICDADGLSLGQAVHIGIGFASMLVEAVEKCAIFRMKGIHIVNQPYVFNMVYALFKPFFQGILKTRMYLHGRDRESLYSYFEPEILPINCGGQIDVSDPNLTENMAAYLRSQQDKFSNIINYGYTTEDK